jgi:hypothetical protein
MHVPMINHTLLTYEGQVRSNRSPAWDTLAAVAACTDGIYGAEGEVHETFAELYDRDPNEEETAALRLGLDCLKIKFAGEIAAETKEN